MFLAAVTVSCNFEESSIEFIITPDTALAAIEISCHTLDYFTEELKNTPHIVIAAVKRGYPFKNLSAELRNNPHIVLAAIEQNGQNLEHASEDLKNNPGFLLAAAKINGLVLKVIPEDLKTRELSYAAAEQNLLAQPWAPKALIDEALFHPDNPDIFPLLPVEKKNTERAIEALSYNPLFVRCIPAEILLTIPPEILRSAITGTPHALSLIDHNLLTADLIKPLVYNHDSLIPNNAATDENENRKIALKTLADSVIKREINDQEIINILVKYFNDDEKFMIFVITEQGVNISEASQRLQSIPAVFEPALEIDPSDEHIPSIFVSELYKINAGLFQ